MAYKIDFMSNLIMKTRLVNLFFFFVSASLLTLTACKKSSDTIPVFNGNYSGKYAISNSGGIIYIHTEGPVNFTFNDSTYVCTNNGSNFSVGGAGKFIVHNGSNISFINLTVYQDLVYTLYTLNGDYTYNYKGDSLIISKQLSNVSAIEYRIKKN
jgi:hypothetical protein